MPDLSLLWVGSIGGMEQALVERAGVAFQGIDTGKVRGGSVVQALRSLLKMVSGVRQSLRIIKAFRPQVCFVTGGYVCTPVVIACRLRRIPVLIYLPDMTPGYAIRWLSKLAQRVAVSYEEAAPFFGGVAPRGKAVVTGYPVRQELAQAVQKGDLGVSDRPDASDIARQKLSAVLQLPLNNSLPLVLVWGGSQGARSINQATWAALPEILRHSQVLHIIGQRDWELYRKQPLNFAADLKGRYYPISYLHEEMILALLAADLTVSRAGASVLGEYPVARLPSILVPLTGVNQEENAAVLAKHGAAFVIADDRLAQYLGAKIVQLLQHPQQRQAMRQALASLAIPHAAFNIAKEIVLLAN